MIWLLASWFVFCDAITVRSTVSSANPTWWAKVEGEVLRRPDSSTGLSQKVEHYFYAFGSKSAIPANLRKRRVAGSNKVHVFHLPEGPPEAPVQKDRRSSLSSFVQLTHGAEVSSSFPDYSAADYVNPLTSTQQTKETAIMSSLSEQSLKTELENLEKMTTRSWSDASATTAAVNYLSKELNTAGFATCKHDYSYAGTPQQNVVGYLPGTGSGSAVILGAHFDSRPYTGAAPGAVDNGSGVAALLAVAKAFKAQAVSVKRPVYFVLFGTEEAGLKGSEAFVSALQGSSLPTACQHSSDSGSAKAQALIMDEIGWRSSSLSVDTVNLESYDDNKDVMDHMAEASKTHNGDSLRVTHSSNPFGSDHMSFLNNGMHAVLSIMGDDESYPHYHQSSDDISQVSWPLLTRIAKMNAGGLYRLANM